MICSFFHALCLSNLFSPNNGEQKTFVKNNTIFLALFSAQKYNTAENIKLVGKKKRGQGTERN